MAHPKRAETIPCVGTAYDIDLAAWSLEQAAHLRHGAWSKLDIQHVIDEVESVARTEREAPASALRIVLLDMLKWDYQPTHRTRSWVTSIRVQRLAAEERIEDSPSLRPQLDDILARAYRRACIEASAETSLPDSTFPEACPYTIDETLNRDFPWPSEGSEKASIPS